MNRVRKTRVFVTILLTVILVGTTIVGCDDKGASSREAVPTFCPTFKAQGLAAADPLGNSPPMAYYQTVVTNDSEPATIVLWACDPDGPVDPGVISSLSWSMPLATNWDGPPPPPWHGELSHYGGDYPDAGVVIYDPDPGYIGTDSFPYQVFDGTNAGNTAIVSIEILPVTPQLYVNGASNALVPDGLSWTTAFRHPQDAMDVASSGDMIWVAQGAYYSRTTDPGVPVLAMKPGVEIFGGFNGSETTIGQRNVFAYSTVLSADANANQYPDEVYNIVTGASDSILDGFSIEYGGDLNSSNGAGVYISGVNGMRVSNCIISNNVADAGGGIFVNNSSNILIGATQFNTNQAYPEGVYRSGGAIAAINATGLQIIGCSFDQNTGDAGGGVYFQGGSSNVISNSVFQQNNASNDNGGAIASSAASFRVNGSTFTLNANRGMYIVGGNVQVVNSVFNGNSNTFADGGAIYLGTTGNLQVVHSTFYNNFAYAYGGAIALSGSGTRQASVTNSILWGSAATLSIGALDKEIYPLYDVEIQYSDVDPGNGGTVYPGTGNIGSDPLFINPASGYFYLNTGSPCIDSGTDAGVSEDFYGNPRPQGSGFDMGEFEQ